MKYIPTINLPSIIVIDKLQCEHCEEFLSQLAREEFSLVGYGLCPYCWKEMKSVYTYKKDKFPVIPA
jgi:hypothetical protein